MYNNTVYRDTVAMKNNQAPANLSQLINTWLRVAPSSTLRHVPPRRDIPLTPSGQETVSYLRKVHTKQHVRTVVTYDFNQLCFHCIRDMEFSEGGF
jgi:hypothetical protein